MPATTIMPEQENGMLSPATDCACERGSSSAPQSRSNSWKNNRKNAGDRRDRKLEHMGRANSLSMPDCSSDNKAVRNSSLCTRDDTICAVRSFRTTSKGIVDSGSFYKSVSSNSLLSSGSLATTSGSCNTSRRPSEELTRTGSIGSTDSSDEGSYKSCQSKKPSYFRTLVLGAPGVGKTSLIKQLTCMGPASPISDEDESRVCTSGHVVSVHLDGHETTMEFIDGAELSELEFYHADAYVLLYAVSEPESFTLAASLLSYLRQDLDTDRTIYLVSNKTDLVRQSQVPSEDARRISSLENCNFIDTSTALNINLDELLIGLLCSIEKQLTPVELQPGDGGVSAQTKVNHSHRKPRSPSRAISAIGQFLRYACRRDSKQRDGTPVPQLV